MTVTLDGTSGITTPGITLDGINIQPTFCVQAVMQTAASTTTAGWQKVPVDTMVSDVPGWWDNTNKRVIPKVPGFYTISGRARVTAVGIAALGIGKNGSAVIAVGTDTSSTVLAIGGSASLYCNGTTDYLELFTYATAVKTYNNSGFDTYLQVVGPFGNAV